MERNSLGIAPFAWLFPSSGNTKETLKSPQPHPVFLVSALYGLWSKSFHWDIWAPMRHSGLRHVPSAFHTVSINLSITLSHFCYQCLVAFPTASQVLCPLYPYMFLFLSRSCARWSCCSFAVGVSFSLVAYWPPVHKDKGQNQWQRALYSLWVQQRQPSGRWLGWICSTLFIYRIGTSS